MLRQARSTLAYETESDTLQSCYSAAMQYSTVLQLPLQHVYISTVMVDTRSIAGAQVPSSTGR